MIKRDSKDLIEYISDTETLTRQCYSVDQCKTNELNIVSFRFTSAVRASMLYDGGGLISIGGGEGLWLYINKVLMVESISSAELLIKQCYTVDLSEARENGMLLTLSFIEKNISYLSYYLHCCTTPDKRCLSHDMCLY